MASNVIIIVADTLRRDRLSHYADSPHHTPFLDGLASEHVDFSRAIAPSSWTVPSHASLFSGLEPSLHNSISGSVKFTAESIVEEFSHKGFKTIAASANPWLVPEFGFDRGFDILREVTTDLPFPKAGNPHRIIWRDPDNILKATKRWIADGPSVQRFINLLYSRIIDLPPRPNAQSVNREAESLLTDVSGPVFMFLNYMDVHAPHIPREKYFSENTVDSTELGDYIWINPVEHPPQLIRGTYASSVSYLDDQLNQLFSKINDKLGLDDTLCIIIGDHGEGLGENGYWGHGTYLYDSLIEVPMIVRTSQGTKETIDRPISLTSIPTALEESLEDENIDEEKFIHSLKNMSSDKYNPVIAEVFGNGGSDSANGYGPFRRFVWGTGSVVHDLNNETYDITGTVPDSWKKVVDELESRLHNSPANTAIEIENEKIEQLRDLGYF